MIARSEKLRRTISWVAAILILFIVVFSKSPFQESYVYEAIEIFGFVLLSLAVLGRIWCTVYIGGHKDEQLCQDGPYSMCRNPLYVFSFLGLMGILCAAKILTLVPVAALIYWGYYYCVIESEEKRLSEVFGQEYAEYCGRVNRILPTFRNYWTRDAVVSHPSVIVKSISDASVFMWLFVMTEILEYLKAPGISGEAIMPALWQLPF